MLKHVEGLAGRKDGRPLNALREADFAPCPAAISIGTALTAPRAGELLPRSERRSSRAPRAQRAGSERFREPMLI